MIYDSTSYELPVLYNQPGAKQVLPPPGLIKCICLACSCVCVCTSTCMGCDYKSKRFMHGVMSQNAHLYIIVLGNSYSQITNLIMSPTQAFLGTTNYTKQSKSGGKKHKLYQAIQKWRQEAQLPGCGCKLECELQEGGGKERWGGKKGEGRQEGKKTAL